MCVCVVVEMWSTNVGYCVRVFAQRELIFWEDINVSGWKEVVNLREFVPCIHLRNLTLKRPTNTKETYCQQT